MNIPWFTNDTENMKNLCLKYYKFYWQEISERA